jgi:hypothetical protein
MMGLIYKWGKVFWITIAVGSRIERARTDTTKQKQVERFLKGCVAMGTPILPKAVRNMERAGVPRSVAMKISGHKTENIYQRDTIVNESDIQDATRRLLRRNLGTTPSSSVDIAHVSG